ncbi:MAG: DUF1353 domain-containing protein [Candidatus Desantisbacteria bacterium]
MSNYGSFSGNPKTEWLVDKNGEDRNMSLLNNFWYIDPNGKKWNAPKGHVIDGASIPRPLWSTVGSPYTDDYRRASVVHDVACDDPTVLRKDADIMFYFACLAGGCSLPKAKLLYAGVRIGAWYIASLVPESISAKKLLFRVPSRISADEQFLQMKFNEIANELAGLSDKASITEIDAVLDRHVKF